MYGYFVEAPGTDPCINLAIEEYLVRLNDSLNAYILYLWQNEDTVVIGRNQNAYKECDLLYAGNNGIKVVRRLTGGGAVYHDRGNLNYSMIMPIDSHDTARSSGVIRDALLSLGIEAEISGRNDICAGGGKISGNAYHTNDKTGLHHGTILYRADKERMEEVLNVPADKLEKRGIASVKSRVNDIVSIRPGLSLLDVSMAVRKSFGDTYDIDEFGSIEIPMEEITVLAGRYESDEWNLYKVTGAAGTDAL